MNFYWMKFVQMGNQLAYQNAFFVLLFEWRV